MSEVLTACSHCGDWWEPEGLVEVHFVRVSPVTTTLCLYCVDHAVRCDHAQKNLKRCAYCWEKWAGK